jgi:hypothetical protein
MAENRDKNGKFLPGNHGGGRPKKAEWLKNEVLKDLPLYYERLKIFAQGGEKAKPKEQINAIELLLAYGLGKPTQAVELSGRDGEPIRIILEGDADKWAQ